jgi:hypothetical protein
MQKRKATLDVQILAIQIYWGQLKLEEYIGVKFFFSVIQKGENIYWAGVLGGWLGATSPMRQQPALKPPI